MMPSLHPPLAVVIEPSSALADSVADCLRARDFEVLVASTHAGAAKLVIERLRVDFLVAAIPAPGEDHTGAFLAVARAQNPGMALLVMLSDPNEAIPDAPPVAIRLVKPFSRAQLADAIDRAAVFAGAA
ncbi:hypothetical protein KPL74_04845 [Bacillus sp. NP157]|nr:hypothetical protein KPL74_04845 [Bacillus sp. NP157]